MSVLGETVGAIRVVVQTVGGRHDEAGVNGPFEAFRMARSASAQASRSNCGVPVAGRARSRALQQRDRLLGQHRNEQTRRGGRVEDDFVGHARQVLAAKPLQPLQERDDAERIGVGADRWPIIGRSGEVQATADCDCAEHRRVSSKDQGCDSCIAAEPISPSNSRRLSFDNMYPSGARQLPADARAHSSGR